MTAILFRTTSTLPAAAADTQTTKATATTIALNKQHQQQQQRRFSAMFGLDFVHGTRKPFADMRRTKAERKKGTAAAVGAFVVAGPAAATMAQQATAPPPLVEQFPDTVWARIVTQLGPLERIRLGQCNKRLRALCARWEDVNAVEIRPDWAGDAPSSCPASPIGGSFATSITSPTSSFSVSSAAFVAGLPSLVRPKSSSRKQPRGFRVRLQLKSPDGIWCRIRTATTGGTTTALESSTETAENLLKTLLARMEYNNNNNNNGGNAATGAVGGLTELSIWDACLGDRFRSAVLRCCGPRLRCVHLWNCARYLDSSQHRCPALLLALLSLPSLRQLLILDSTPVPSPSSSPTDAVHQCHTVFAKQMARALCAPLEEFQLTNCRLPLRSLELLVPKCGHSLRRLAIGCTFGKEQKRADYMQLLRHFRGLTDLDLPPFLFHLANEPQLDTLTQQLIQALPRLRALGFRHFNSSALFRFIEMHLPLQIRLLRVHHNAHRVPNFAELGFAHHHHHQHNRRQQRESVSGASSPPALFSSSCRSITGSLLLPLLPGSPDSQRSSSRGTTTTCQQCQFRCGQQQQQQQQKKCSVVSRCSLPTNATSTGGVCYSCNTTTNTSHNSSTTAGFFAESVASRFRFPQSIGSICSTNSSYSLKQHQQHLPNNNGNGINLKQKQKQEQQQRPLRSSTFCTSATGQTLISMCTPTTNNNTNYSSSSNTSNSSNSNSCSSNISASSSVSSIACATNQLAQLQPNCGDSSSRSNQSYCWSQEDAYSMATSTTWCTMSTTDDTTNNKQQQEHGQQEQESGGSNSNAQMLSVLEQLARRKLTILAIAEERNGGSSSANGGGGGVMIAKQRKCSSRQQRLRKCTYAGVDVIYVSPLEAKCSQEVVGRMGAPIQSPFVYTTGQANGNGTAATTTTGTGSGRGGAAGGGGANNGNDGNGAGNNNNSRRGVLRVIRGDLVRAIPLASLGMESDWESDDEGGGGGGHFGISMTANSGD